MRYLGGFRIDLFPKYVGDEAARDIGDNLLAQRAFWSSLHLLVISGRGRSAELRIMSQGEDRSLTVYLLLIGHEASRDDDLIALVAQMLPRGYVWSVLGIDDLPRAVEPHRGAHAGWRIARVVRRLQYIDLPSFLPARDLSEAESPFTGLRFRLDGPELEDRRYLPEDPNEFLAQIETTRYCLPLMSPLEGEATSDRRLLWEDMQACAPVVVSLTMHPFPEDSLDSDRQVATRFRSLVDYLGGALANSGFAHAQGLRGVFDRFFLTRAHLGIGTIRVAATTDAFALGVAHRLCTWLGAMRTFAVLAPTRSFDVLANALADPEIDFPRHEASVDWVRPTERARKTLVGEGIELPEDPRYLRFLLRLPHTYSIQEAEKLLQLPFGLEHGIPGLSTQMLPPFVSGPQRFDPVLASGMRASPRKDRIRIGRINPRATSPGDGGDDGLHWHSIPVQDLTKHALIVGSTGSGKTVTTVFLMRELLRLGVPFLVVEPVKTEYFSGLRNLPEITIGEVKVKRFRLEGTSSHAPASDFLAFDPLRLQSGITVARHVSYLKSCFEAAFPMEAWQSLFLENGLLDYYLAPRGEGGCGLALFMRGGSHTVRIVESSGSCAQVFPSFQTFSAYFLGPFLERELARPDAGKGGRPPAADRIEEFRQLFRRRFENLGRGPVGEMFRQADRLTIRDPKVLHTPFAYLLRQPTVIELDAIPDGDQKALVMAFLMTFLYERRQGDDLAARERGEPPPSALHHVMVVEEAHRLLANPAGSRRGDSVGLDSKTKAVSLFVDMLAEIRAFGQGLVIVEQIPTKLTPEAVKNTNLKIMLRLTARDDRDYLGEAMNFNEEQKRFVNTLRAERGRQVQFVAFDENVDQPVLLSLPLRAIPPGSAQSLFDEYFVSD